MPQETNRFMRLFALLLTPLLLAACDAPKQADASAEPPLAGALIGGDFALTGEDGKTVEWKEFAGQWRIVYFGYTFCPDVCPVDAVAIGQGLRQFEKDSPEQGKNVTPIFITVDPERDTPEVLAEFTDSFHPRMIGLTGSVDDIAATAKKFVVWFEKGEPTENGGYLVNHTNQTVLFDPQGNPVALLPTDKGGKAVAQDLAKWVK
ncbi:SCO family protein [Croceicoccus naphthovorans]|uniref:Electron transporter n=2 Tax=Croceicoccus naphthovorans TaxID=1348774 RepID=A0A0G3XJL1_9SPHN|nr:SCO family protein [Croceicoccus naphthovorans]AKM11397.1 electron transporter [Croceicoccus naphthovorans]